MNQCLACKIGKFLKEDIGENLCDSGLNEYFRCNIKCMINKRKNCKLKFIKIKNFLSKDTVRRMKRQATNSEKILVNHLYDKVPISRINQELSNLNNKKKNQNEQMI